MDYEDRNGILVPKGKLVVGGTFFGKIIREGEVVDEWDCHNLIVNQGLDHILAVEFTGAPQLNNWYLAPYTNNYVPVGTDTAASIAANAGETSNYTASTRVGYVGVEANQQVTNAAAPCNFTFNAHTVLYGAFMISSSGFNATTGVLFAASQFPSPKTVEANDQLLLTYVFGAASA
jgi:hypothetical protein